VFLLPNSILKSGSKKADFSLASISKALKAPQKQDFSLSQANKFLAESPELLTVGNCSLKSATPPVTFSPQALGALVEGYETEDTKKTITEYAVELGDNLWSIAAKFDVSLNTILWANNLNKDSLLQTGQKLIIPPVSGVIHHVKSGDTVSSIAQKYKGKSEEIIAINNLSGEGDIYIGDIVIVPNGAISVPTTQYAPLWVPLATSYFICPVAAPCRITQGLHWYNAIDFSHGQCGEPIYAAAAGQVLKVKLTNSTSRWAFSGAGNTLSILHPNGVVTSYGHIAVSLVNPGDQVSQGQAIALMGGQPGTPGAGLSTGCHLHFGVSGARNPFAR
jgi:LysM repeat protein